MEVRADEEELIHKLVVKQHLSVPERRLLPGGKASLSLVLAAVESALKVHGWLPIDWRPDEDFSGGLIEYKPDGSCRIYWKSEVACQRYELDAVRECTTAREGAELWIRGMFQTDIDGVPIDWSA